MRGGGFIGARILWSISDGGARVLKLGVTRFLAVEDFLWGPAKGTIRRRNR